MDNKKNKLLTIIKEFTKVGERYNIQGISVDRAKFYARVEQGMFEEIPKGNYEIIEEGNIQYLVILNLEYLATIERFQICYEFASISSTYEVEFSDVDINILTERYNEIVEDVKNLFKHIKTNMVTADGLDTFTVMPTLDTDEVWVKTDNGWRGFNIGNLEDNIKGMLVEIKKITTEYMKEISNLGDDYIEILKDINQGVIDLNNKSIEEITTLTESKKGEINNLSKSQLVNISGRFNEEVEIGKKAINTLTDSRIREIGSEVNKGVETINNTYSGISSTINNEVSVGKSEITNLYNEKYSLIDTSINNGVKTLDSKYQTLTSNLNSHSRSLQSTLTSEGNRQISLVRTEGTTQLDKIRDTGIDAKQDKTDRGLFTLSKDIVGAINEVHNKANRAVNTLNTKLDLSGGTLNGVLEVSGSSNGKGSIVINSTYDESKYIGIYKNDGSTRKGWLGFGESNSTTFSIKNEESGTTLSIKGNGELYYNSNVGFQGNVAITGSGRTFRAYHNYGYMCGADSSNTQKYALYGYENVLNLGYSGWNNIQVNNPIKSSHDISAPSITINGWKLTITG